MAHVIGSRAHGDGSGGTKAKVGSRRPAMAVLALVLVILAIVISMPFMSWKDPRARRGYYEGKSQEEIQRELDEEVDWYAMEISVASAMEATEGQTQVEARLENVANNHCDQKVRMYRTDDPSDVLFESGAIAPGEYLQYVDLAHPLPVGRHLVTVEFQGYEQSPSLVADDGKLFGHDRFGASAAAEVAITVRPANVTTTAA